MPTTSTKYSVSNMRQLVDLNGDMTNFMVEFTAKSTNNEEFECLVVDQQTLDEGLDLQYKKVPGYINGSVSSDKNIYQNYFLILRSQKPCTVEVTINSERLSDELPIQGNNSQLIPSKDELIMLTDDTSSNSGLMSWLTNWKIILAILALACVIYIIYKNKNIPTTTTSTTTTPEINIDDILKTPPQMKVDIDLPPPPLEIKKPRNIQPVMQDNGLASKLKSFRLD